MKIAILTVPCYGHFKTLSRLALSIVEADEAIEITFIITGWQNYSISDPEIQILHHKRINLRIITSTIIKHSGATFSTFNRAYEITDQVIQASEKHDFIIYDFLSPEGYIAGKCLKISALCFIPAVIGPFNPQHHLFVEGCKANQLDIKRIEKKYSIKLADRIEMVSECLFVPSDVINIYSSWPKLIKASNFTINRTKSRYFFLRPKLRKIDRLKAKPRKLIYCSLGTVIPHESWDHIPQLRNFIKYFYDSLFNAFADHPNYEFIIASGRAISSVTSQPIPANFRIYLNVPQPELLSSVDAFITHGGGNSVNEAIDARVPMIVIPFMFDQHQCAKNVDKLNIGIAFQHTEADQEDAINADSGKYFRESLANFQVVILALEKILHDESYQIALQQMKQQPPLDTNALIHLLKNEKNNSDVSHKTKSI